MQRTSDPVNLAIHPCPLTIALPHHQSPLTLHQCAGAEVKKGLSSARGSMGEEGGTSVLLFLYLGRQIEVYGR